MRRERCDSAESSKLSTEKGEEFDGSLVVGNSFIYIYIYINIEV